MKNITIICCIAAAALASCSRNVNPTAAWTPSPEFTGTDIAATIDSLSQGPDSTILYGESNKLYRSELLFKKDEDINDSPFVQSVIERYDRLSFVRYVNSEFEIMQRMEGDYVPEVTFSQDEISRIVRGDDLSARFAELSLALKDGNEDLVNKAAGAIINAPYETPDPVSEEDVAHFAASFDSLYDKEAVVPDIYKFVDDRLHDTSDVLSINISLLHVKMKKASDIDKKCVLALEYSKSSAESNLDWLGDIIESQEYSKYLYEVWMQWKNSFQGQCGFSSWAVIPDMYYEKVRNVVLNTMLRQVQEHPDDLAARCFAFNIAVESNLERFGGLFGNAALTNLSELANYLFLPQEMLQENEY